MVEIVQLKRKAFTTWHGVAMTAMMHRILFNGHIHSQATLRRILGCWMLVFGLDRRSKMFMSLYGSPTSQRIRRSIFYCTCPASHVHIAQH